MKLRKSYRLRILKLISICFSFIFFISCAKKNENVSVENGTTADSALSLNHTDTGKITYLALGDSYTIGESVSESERFPNQLVALLRNNHIKMDAPDMVAATGWTTDDLLSALNTNPPKSDYSFVTLLIGVNNQYQGRSLDEYKTEFNQLLNLAIACAANKKEHVFVLSIPDYSVTPFGNNIDKEKTARQIDEFNKANLMISQSAGVNYLDITPISREVANDLSLVAIDQLHPSAQQYLKWDQLLAPLILNKLVNKSG